MAAFGENQVGRVLGGRYRLLAPVGTGASATVYLAEDAQLRRRIAVKILHPTLADDPAFLKRFRAEAQAAAQLSHPNVVAVYDWGEDSGTPYLVTEYLGGGSVRAMLDRGRLLTPSQALVVGLEAAKALDYAHRQGFVHRDIKPANLLFGEDGRLRIADFGLARAIAEAAWTEPAGVVLGTARYASPEQAKGQAVDGKTDVYSLSLSLVEAVTGKVPFAADTTVATLMNRLDKLMPVSADLGPLASVLERAGRPDPEERFDAGQLARAFVQTAERLPRPAPLPLVPTLALERQPDDTLLGPAVAVAVPAAALARAGVGPDVPAAPPSGTGAAPPVEPSVPAVPGEPVLPGASPAPAGRGAGGGEGGGSPARPDDEPEVVLGARRPRRTLRVFLAVVAALLLAAVGAVAVLFYQNSQVPSYAVPPLVGLEEDRARNLVEPNEWAVRVVTEKNDDQPVGIVFAQDPESGELKRGESFTLFVSAGPTDSPVPDLTGRTGDEARALVEEQRLVYNPVEERFDEDVPAGVVISWSVGGEAAPPGTMIVKGSTVDVVLSLGPAPRTVPKLVGRTFEEAEAALAEQRLGVNRLPDEFSDQVEAGRVMRIDPAAGTEVPRDTVVTVVVSKGPDLVTVPDVNGQALPDARAALEAAGVVLGQVAGPETSPVIATSPAAGAVVRRGSAVNVLLG